MSFNPIAYLCIHSVLKKFKFTESEIEASEMKNCKSGFWKITNLYPASPDYEALRIQLATANARIAELEARCPVSIYKRESVL